MVLDTESSLGVEKHVWEACFSLLLPEAKNRYCLPTSMVCAPSTQDALPHFHTKPA